MQEGCCKDVTQLYPSVLSPLKKEVKWKSPSVAEVRRAGEHILQWSAVGAGVDMEDRMPSG